MSGSAAGSTNAAKTVMLVGAGALANAWVPLFRALRQKVFPQLLDDSGLANQLLARQVQKLRLFCGDGRVPDSEDMERLRDQHHAFLEAIRVEFTLAELKARPRFTPIVQKLVPPDSELKVITTNWDFGVDRAVNASRPGTGVLHLHGRIDNPFGLYLPSETSTERYHLQFETVQYAGATFEALETLSAATHVLVYGLSFDPLDAELCNIAWASRPAQLRRIDVVDIYPEDVAKRLALAFYRSLPPEGIRYWYPDDVEAQRFGRIERDFTIRPPREPQVDCGETRKSENAEAPTPPDANLNMP